MEFYVNSLKRNGGIKTGNRPRDAEFQDQSRKPENSRWESCRPRHTNAAHFPNPPIDPAALDASGNTLTEAVIAAMDGGKTAKAVVKKQRKLVIQDLNLLAVFVQNVSNDDPAIFAVSGFTMKPTGKSAPQPVAVPVFKSIDFGANSGQIVISVRKVTGGRSYFTTETIICI